MAGSDTSEGQAVWQPGGAEEDSRLHEGNRHLHLAYDEEEEEEGTVIRRWCGGLGFAGVPAFKRAWGQPPGGPEDRPSLQKWTSLLDNQVD